MRAADSVKTFTDSFQDSHAIYFWETTPEAVLGSLPQLYFSRRTRLSIFPDGE
jgi:hypothetical protein